MAALTTASSEAEIQLCHWDGGWCCRKGSGTDPLTSLQQRLVKTGGRLIKHARYYWLLLAESHLSRRLFASMLGRINGLSLPSG